MELTLQITYRAEISHLKFTFAVKLKQPAKYHKNLIKFISILD